MGVQHNRLRKLVYAAVMEKLHTAWSAIALQSGMHTSREQGPMLSVLAVVVDERSISRVFPWIRRCCRVEGDTLLHL